MIAAAAEGPRQIFLICPCRRTVDVPPSHLHVPSLSLHLITSFEIHITSIQRLCCPSIGGNCSQKSPLCFNLVQRTAAKHELKLLLVVKGCLSTRLLPSNMHHQSVASLSRSPSLVCASALLSPTRRRFLPDDSLRDLLSAWTELI